MNTSDWASDGKPLFSERAGHLKQLITSTEVWDSLTVVFASLSESGVILAANHGFRAATQIEVERVVDLPIHRFLSPESHRKLLQVLRSLHTTGTSGQLVLEVSEGASEPVVLLTRVTRLANDEYLLVATDVSRQQRTERYLLERERQLMQSLQSAGVATWELDLESMAFLLDEVILRFIGCSAEQAPDGEMSFDTLLSQYLHPSESSQFVAALLKIARDQRMDTEQHFGGSVKNSAGEYQPVQFIIRGFRDGSESLSRIFGSIQFNPSVTKPANAGVIIDSSEVHSDEGTSVNPSDAIRNLPLPTLVCTTDFEPVASNGLLLELAGLNHEQFDEQFDALSFLPQEHNLYIKRAFEVAGQLKPYLIELTGEQVLFTATQQMFGDDILIVGTFVPLPSLAEGAQSNTAIPASLQQPYLEQDDFAAEQPTELSESQSEPAPNEQNDILKTDWPDQVYALAAASGNALWRIHPGRMLVELDATMCELLGIAPPVRQFAQLPLNDFADEFIPADQHNAFQDAMQVVIEQAQAHIRPAMPYYQLDYQLFTVSSEEPLQVTSRLVLVLPPAGDAWIEGWTTLPQAHQTNDDSVSEPRSEALVSQASLQVLARLEAMVAQLQYDTPLKRRLRQYMEEAVLVTKASRAGLWLLQPEQRGLYGVLRYHQAIADHTEGDRLGFPADRGELPEGFSEAGLFELDLQQDAWPTWLQRSDLMMEGPKATSLLFVPIFQGASSVGYLVLEGAGGAWPSADKLFAITLASLLALVLEGEEQQQRDAELHELQAKLARLTRELETVTQERELAYKELERIQTSV